MGLSTVIKEYIFEGEQEFIECHASTILLLDNEDLLAAWFGGTREKEPDVAIWFSRKTNGKWSSPKKAADEIDIACWNPVLFKGEDGKIILFFKVGVDVLQWYTKFVVSEDNGYTWGEPKELVHGDIGGRGPVKNKAITLSNGILAAPASLETKTEWDSFVDFSFDGGLSWRKSEMVPIDRSKLRGKGIIQPSLWESEPGKLHMLARSTEGFVYRSDSADGGNTWCEAYPIDVPNNNSGIDLVKMDNGKLVMVCNPLSAYSTSGARTPIVCLVSEDNGLTWNDEFLLEHNESPQNKKDGEFSYPAIVANGEYVYITYTWKRKTIAFWKLGII